jgi:riboflavin kinase/FMN adenylyltransferase
MRLVSSTNISKNQDIGVTIGNFDGLHLGHDYLLHNFISECKKMNIEPVVITFNPHPLVHLKSVSSFLIQNIETKKRILRNEYNVSFVEIEFNNELQKMNGKSFFEALNRMLPNIKLFFAGHDFGLGVNKSINYNEAKLLLSDIKVIQDIAFEQNNIKISSSLIRKELNDGNIRAANQYLNRAFSLIGKVVKGNQIGITLGFPTANILIDEVYLIPKSGVYACEVIIGNETFLGSTNIGIRPTVTTDTSPTVEIHILDFDQTIYDEYIEIHFYRRIRDEIKFNSKDDLIKQIKDDVKFVSVKGLFKPFALVGRDIKHSKSEDVYIKLLNTNNISYTLLDYKSSSDIEDLKSLLNKYSYISITSPYKNYFFNKVDIIDESLKDLESVNCIKLFNNKVIGTNTDYFAIKEITLKLLQSKHSNILILGDGTMSNLVQYFLSSINKEFKVLSRKNNQLKELSKRVKDNSLIINTCSRSYTPTVESSCSCTFWDLNYNQSYALEFSKNKFINYYDGLGMLTLQAKYALSFWNLKSF